MKSQTEPFACGLFAGLLVLLIGLIANAGCYRDSKLDTVEAGPDFTAYWDAAVQITVHCVGPNGEVAWYGSGVIISETSLLTAGHVAEQEDPSDVCSFAVETATGATYLVYPMTVLASDAVDLARMEIISFTQKFYAPPVRFGAVPQMGDEVCTSVGYPRREQRCGLVMHPDDPPGDIRMDLTVEPGNSGSGLYDMSGYLVGIVVHTYPNRGNGQYVSGGATSLAGHLQELL